MPEYAERKTLERARKAKREGKAPTTQAGEFVREEMELLGCVFTSSSHPRAGRRVQEARRAGGPVATRRLVSLAAHELASAARTRSPGRDMRGSRRGPKPRPVDPRVKQLEAENARLQRKLQQADTIITL